jgi:hypothetical protein
MKRPLRILDYVKSLRIRRQLKRGARSYIAWARDYKAVDEIWADKSINTPGWPYAVDYFEKLTGRRVSSIRVYRDAHKTWGWKRNAWPATKWRQMSEHLRPESAQESAHLPHNTYVGTSRQIGKTASGFSAWYDHAGPGDIAAAFETHHKDNVQEKLAAHAQDRFLFACHWYDNLMQYYLSVGGKLIDPTVYPIKEHQK